MYPVPPSGGESKWARRIEQMLFRLADIGQRTVGIARWERLLEGALAFLGVRSLTATQAQLLAGHLHEVLNRLIAVCHEQNRALKVRTLHVPLTGIYRSWGGPDCDILQASLQGMAGIMAQLDAVLDEYAHLIQPATAPTALPAHLPDAGTMPPWAADTRPVTLSFNAGGKCRKVGRELYFMNLRAARIATHIQQSISGPHESNSFAITGAVAGLHMLAGWMRHHEAHIREQLGVVAAAVAR
jgi:hypothetical protein